MTPITTRPTPPNRMLRDRSPRSRLRARLREPHSDGSSRYGNATAMGPARTGPAGGVRALDNLVDLLQPAAAGELEEHRCQLIVQAPRQCTQLVDRAARDDLALEDDGDAVAHLLRHFER